jgi:phosphoribosylformimino-5-aminoimidazole carboxamide ribotide isomerase
MRFRPCIDLRGGKVVQIVGATLAAAEAAGAEAAGAEAAVAGAARGTTATAAAVRTNFESDRPASWFASLYAADRMHGGHVIALGPGNESAALAALAAFPGGMQMGGGIDADNAARYLAAGASHVIVTSYVFRAGALDRARLGALVRRVGRERLVLDLSCRRIDGAYRVLAERWRTVTDLVLTAASLRELAGHCAEFLVHAVDVEGLRAGIDAELVALLADLSPVPVTYAGGVRSLADLDIIATRGHDRVDASIGSALDLFGGSLAYADAVCWSRARESLVLPR